MAAQSSNIDEVIEKIIGYSERIDTPFGEMCTLSCDLSSNGRLYSPIEECVRKLRSHLMQRQQSQTFDGQITQNMYSYSVNTILEFFGLNSKSYQIEECGSHEISPYTYLGKILQINFPNRNYKGQDTQGGNVENQRIPQVYVSTSESYYNIIPWTFYGSKIHSIDVNKQSEINSSQLIDKLSKQSENDLHIVSLSAVSNMTGQKLINLENIIKSVLGLRAEMEQRNKNIKIYICLDITQITQREKINASEGVYKDIDFFIVQGTKFLGGGFDSTNIIISRKESATNILQPQLPLQDLNNNILDSLKENDDPTKLYRIALSLQFLESVQFQKINELEKKNIELFLKEIAAANKDLKKLSVLRNINIQGVISEKTELQYGNLHFNLYVPGSEVFDDENKSYLHPDFVSQMLHDLFGILVTIKRNVKINDQITMLNVPKNIYSKLDSIGSSESMVGCIQLDINFLHKEEEIKYIAQALKLICEKGEELLRYYDKKTFLMNNFNYEIFDLHFNQMMKVNDTREQVVLKRGQKYDAQMQVAKNVFKNYPRYFSLHDGYTKEKTLQIQKKQPPFCMPPLLAQKSLVKLPDEGDDESKLNLQKIAISKAQEYVKDEIERLEQERQRLKKLNLQESVIIKAPPPPQVNKNLFKLTEKLIKTEPTLSKEDMERQFQELIEKRLNEKARQEKEDMERMLQQMKREMKEQIESSSTYKEQFVFEDLQPSVMFKNVLDHREKRYRNLRQIFNNYAKQYLEQLESGKKKKSRFDIITSKDSKNTSIAYPISIDQYLMFCSQFNLLNDQLDTNVASQIYSKSLSKTAMNREMHFTEFISSLEKIALVIYYNHQLLVTSFDKTEALYQYLQIDDIHMLKQKMTALQSINENISANQSSYLNSSPHKMNDLHSLRQNKPSSASKQTLHYLDYDETQQTQQVEQLQLKKKYISTNQPNQYSVQKQSKQRNKQNLFTNQNSDLQWNDIKSVLGNPKSLFKNESNFLYHEYGQQNSSRVLPNSYSKVNSQQQSKNLGASQSSSYMSPNHLKSNQSNKYSSPSPLKNNFESLNLNQNYSQQHSYSQNSPNNRKGYLMMNRAKEIEDSEIKKQQNLLNFLQNNLNSNRYNYQKKKI